MKDGDGGGLPVCEKTCSRGDASNASAATWKGQDQQDRVAGQIGLRPNASN
jgi:hypothetical protein